MEYRNIFIADPAKLSIQRNQLVIQQEQQICVGVAYQATRAAKPPWLPL